MKNISVALIALSLVATVTTAAVLQNNARASNAASMSPRRSFPPDDSTAKVVKTEKEWKRLLTSQQFYVLRQKGTEYAFSGDYKSKGKGVYRCAGCNNLLFSSETKYDSRTGWPSFWKPLRAQSVVEKKDADGERVEVVCKRCDGHLGHVFTDGPKPTGLRYCMNSVAMTFQKK